MVDRHPDKLKRFQKIEIDGLDDDPVESDSGPKLKRFAQLDIDGLPKPKRPSRVANRVAKRVSAPTPAPPQRSLRPMPPPGAPAPRRLPGRPVPRRQVAPSIPPEPAEAYFRERLADLIPPDGMPGMVTVEITQDSWSMRGDRQQRSRLRSPNPPRSTPSRAPYNTYVPPPSPIEITPLAAHEIRLMSREAGLHGCGLRIMAAAGPGEAYDFALEERPEDGDEILVSQGIPIFVRPQVLERLRGQRVTFADLPGHTGFHFEP